MSMKKSVNETICLYIHVYRHYVHMSFRVQNFVKVSELLADKYFSFFLLAEKFRETACAQNIHTRILRLMQLRSNHLILIESAVEVLIIFTELREFRWEGEGWEEGRSGRLEGWEGKE